MLSLFAYSPSNCRSRRTGASLGAIALWGGLVGIDLSQQPRSSRRNSLVVGIDLFFGKLMMPVAVSILGDRSHALRSELIRNIQSGWYRHSAIPT